MAHQGETAEDTITAEEMTGEAIPDSTPPRKKPRNACENPISIYHKVLLIISSVTELMSPKPRTSSNRESAKEFVAKGSKLFRDRDGLQAYIEAPESYPPSRVIYHNDKWVLIHDLYPKATVHFLLLPRDLKFSALHPFEAFNDRQFLSEAKQEAEKAAKIAASELQRIYCSTSAKEKKRLEAMESDDPPLELPAGRDWRSEVKIGIHKGPSMNNLHIHILSKDMHSGRMKHRKHYNSFNTPFFVPLEEFPLDDDDKRRNAHYLESDMKCWRCRKNFGNKFAQLKEHLETEWEEWRKI